MKKSLHLLSVLLLMLIASVSTFASHMAGGNLTYQYLGNNSYHVQLTLYRDCSGITMSLQQTVTANSSCGLVTVVLPLAPGSGNVVSGSACAAFTTCYEEYLYEGILTLPANCADWVFSWNECCRNDAIDNLQNASGQYFHIYATLNSIAAPTNSSPTFSFDPIQVFCEGQEYFFDWGIIEPDGNTLQYSFTTPLSGAAVPIPFNSPYTASCPFPTTPPCNMTINPTTGVLYFIPGQIGEFVFAILIQEYNSAGVLIGSIVRDIQINVVGNCNVLIPTPDPSIAYDSLNLNQGIHLTCGDNSLIYLIDTTVVKVQCGSLAADGSDFRLAGPIGNPNLVPIISAVALNCTAGLLSEIQLNLFQPLKNGIYHLYTKVGNDGNTLIGECGFAIPEFDTVLVIVNDTSQLQLTTAIINCNDVSVTLSYPEGFDCSTLAADASDFSLVDQNGNVFTINTLSSTDCIAGQEYGYQLELTFNFGANIPDTLYFIVQTGTDNNTIANRCGNFSDVNDTLAMITVSGNIPVDLGGNIILCDYDPIPLLDPGVVAQNYTWTLNGDPNPIGTGPTFQPVTGGTYTVLVSDGPTCTGTDDVQISITPSPLIDLGPDISYCIGDPIQDLDATSNGINPTYSWTLNGNPLSTQPVVTPSQTGLYVVEVNVGAQCLGVDSIYISIGQQLIVTIAGTDTLCTGETTDLIANILGPNADTYQWTLNGNTIGGNNATLNASAGGTYSVLVTSATGCTGTHDFVVNAATYPPAPVTACASVTDGQYVYQWVAIPDAVAYQVSVDGGITWMDPSSGITGTQHQTNIPTNNFVVQALNGTKCSPGASSAPTACEIEIPNIITPASNDGKNDVFVIKNLIQYPNNNLKIYNRWGNLIYDKDKYGIDGYWWNGGTSLPGGVYFYVMNLNDGNAPRKGTITVIK